MPPSYRDRVEALYKKYDPAKVGQTDATLAKYKDKEEKVIQALVKKYGPEPTPESTPAATPVATPRATPAGGKSYRDRVEALYKKYDPAKVGQTDATLAKYKDKEEKVIQALVKKYGPEPEGDEASPVAASPAAQPASASSTPAATPRPQSSAGGLSYRDRVEALYKKYDPAKVGQTDATLAKYKDKEEKVIQALVKKYGPEPTPPSTPAATPRAEAPAPAAAAAESTPPTTPRPSNLSYRDRVEALYKKYDPAKVGQTDATLAKYKDKEEKVIQALVKKYGPEPTPPSTPAATPRAEAPAPAATSVPATPARAPRSYRDRVKALYQKYDPAKLPTLDATLAKYKDKEEKVIQALVKKYGPEPAEDEAEPAATPRQEAHDEAESVPATPQPKMERSYRDRVEALYKKYDPAKVGQTDATLAKYKDKEEKVIQALVKKYGPEPESDDASPVAASPAAHEPSKAPERPASVPKVSFARLEEARAQEQQHKEEEAAAEATPAPAAAPAAGDDDNDPALDEEDEPASSTPVQPEATVVPAPASDAATTPVDSIPATPTDVATPRGPAAAAVVGGVDPTKVAKLKAARRMLLDRAVGAFADSASRPVRATAFRRWGVWARDHARQRAMEALLTPRVGGPDASAGDVEWVLEEEQEDSAVAQAPVEEKSVQANQPQQDGGADGSQRAPDTPSGGVAATPRHHGKRYVNRRTGKAVIVPPVDVAAANAAEGKDAPVEIAVRPAAPLPIIEALSALPTSELFYPLLPAPTNVDDVVAAIKAAHQAIAEDLPAALKRATDAETAATSAEEREKMAHARTKKVEQELLNTTELLADERGQTSRLESELRRAADDVDELNEHVNAQQQHIDLLSGELEMERAGIPTALEEETRRKDELAAHLHATLAASRAKASMLQQELRQVSQDLDKERRTNTRLRQQQQQQRGVGHLAVGDASSPSASRLTAQTFSSARKQVTPRGHHARGRAPSADPHGAEESVPSYLAGHAFRHPDAPPHLAPVAARSPSELHAPAYYASSSSKAGGGARRAQQQQRSQSRDDDEDDIAVIPLSPSGDAAREGGSTDSDFSPSPSRGDMRQKAADTGVNETPAPEGVAATASSSNKVRTAADDLDDFLPEEADGADAAAAEAQEDRGDCPHCTDIKLTPFYGSRVGGADSDKVAFCFSCRSAFTRKDLHIRDVRKDNRVYSARIGSAKKASGNKRPVSARR